MSEKNFKWFIKDTTQELSIGDVINVKQVVTFPKWKDFKFEEESTVTLTKEYLESLEKDGYVCKKEVENIPDYTVYIKKMAKSAGKDYIDVITSFGMMQQVNPLSALSIVLKSISNELNSEELFIPCKFWVFDTITRSPKLLDYTKDMVLDNIAWFKSKEDIDYAMKVCKPLINQLYKHE